MYIREIETSHSVGMLVSISVPRNLEPIASFRSEKSEIRCGMNDMIDSNKSIKSKKDRKWYY